jgi:hypothetical protein
MSTELDELAGWVDIYRAAQDTIAKAEEAKAVAREKIEDALGDDEVGTVAGRPVVKWTVVHSERFDQKKARAILGDDVAACMVPQTTRRFTLVDGAE